MAVKRRIVRIGNSRGIRLPKSMLEQAGFGEEVELEVRQGELVIRSPRHIRSGWEERFRQMADQGDDQLLDPDTPPTKWEAEEWEW